MFSFLGLRSRISLAAALCVAVTPVTLPAPVAAQTTGSAVTRYAAALGTANARLPLAARRDLAERLLLLSSYYKLDPSLLAALVTVESAWRARAISPVGALGYGQLMPGTASALQVDALEPYENLDGAARYLRRMLNRFAGRDQQTRMQLALASYNAGAGAVDRYRGIPPYSETRAYVSNVLHVRKTFIASVGMRVSNDIEPLLARSVARSLTLRQAQDDIAAKHHGHSRQLALARATKHPYRSPYLDATDPNSVPLETPAPVRYETSHSFVARLFGMKHRVSAPSSPAPAPVTGAPTADY
jgi:Transglycosylase SLT domain